MSESFYSARLGPSFVDGASEPCSDIAETRAPGTADGTRRPYAANGASAKTRGEGSEPNRFERGGRILSGKTGTGGGFCFSPIGCGVRRDQLTNKGPQSRSRWLE